jgi:hypothetical protein
MVLCSILNEPFSGLFQAFDQIPPEAYNDVNHTFPKDLGLDPKSKEAASKILVLRSVANAANLSISRLAVALD